MAVFLHKPAQFGKVAPGHLMLLNRLHDSREIDLVGGNPVHVPVDKTLLATTPVVHDLSLDGLPV